MHASLILSSLLAMVSIATATPPACLLAALIHAPNPADMKAVCGTLQTNMISNITSVCGTANAQAAYNTYSATCLLQGVTVAKLATSTSSSVVASSTSAKSGSVSASATGTTITMASSTGTASSSGSGSNSGSATATGATTSSTSKAAAAGMPMPTAFVAFSGALAGVAGLVLL